MLKDLLPSPLSAYVPTSADGVISELVAVFAGGLYLTTPPNVLGGLVDYGLSARDDGGTPWSPQLISSKMGRALGKGTYGTAYEAFPTEAGVKHVCDPRTLSSERLVLLLHGCCITAALLPYCCIYAAALTKTLAILH